MGNIVSIDKGKCTGCGACVIKCPQRILYIDTEANKCAVINHNQCDRLRGCEKVCPFGAIKVY
jgi:NAD-dependent dihydropyrimidine dehydrogenase PreA subunit